MLESKVLEISTGKEVGTEDVGIVALGNPNITSGTVVEGGEEYMGNLDAADRKPGEAEGDLGETDKVVGSPVDDSSRRA